MKLAIVGGGPAGLSLAKLLENEANIDITIFESEVRPGGKSLTVRPGVNPIEMGTCYLTASHRRVMRWMKDHNFTLRPLGEQLFDGRDVIHYIRKGSGSPMPFQVVRYLIERSKLLRQLEKPFPSPDALEIAARPIKNWLIELGLGKMIRLMQRAVSSIGYGPLETIPTVQALRWVDRQLIVSGMLKQLKIPVEGWTEFWEALSGDMDLRRSSPVQRVERTSDGVLITANQETHLFDAVVSAIPMDDFLSLLDQPSELEAEISSSMIWGGYAITLLAADNWFKDHPVEAWSDSIVPSAPSGRILSARYEGYEPELGGHLYVTAQYVNGLEPGELVEIMRSELTRFGANVTNVIMHRSWKYMATYDADAIRNGLLAKLEAVQGQNATFYSGAAFSYEAVSHIVEFNAGLAKKISKAEFERSDSLPLAAE